MRVGIGVCLATLGIACGTSANEGSVPEILIPDVRAVVTEADLLLARPYDVAVDADGRVFVVDGQDKHVTVLDPDGRVERTIGGAGTGPGEFALPVELGIDGDSLFVYDLQRRAVSEFRVDGEFVAEHRVSITAVPGAAISFASDRFALTTGGLREGYSLATVSYLEPEETKQIGEPVNTAVLSEDASFFENVAEGLMPEPMRNAAHTVLSADGGVWLFLQTEHLLDRYDREGALVRSTPIAIPEADAIRADYLEWYSNPENAEIYRFLTTVKDGAEINDRLWLLWDTGTERSGLLTVHDDAGLLIRRIVYPRMVAEGGLATAPRRFAIDARASRVYVVGSDSPTLWAFDLPQEALR